MRLTLALVVTLAASTASGQLAPRDAELDSIETENTVSIAMYAVSLPLLFACVPTMIYAGVNFADSRFGDTTAATALVATVSVMAILAALGVLVALGLDIDETSRRRSWQESTRAQVRLRPTGSGFAIDL